MKDQLKNFFFSLNFFLLRVTGKKLQPVEHLNIFNQKNGDISGSSGQNFYRFFLSDSTSKNTSKKSNQNKIGSTPTQKGSFARDYLKSTIENLNFLSVYLITSQISGNVPPHRGRYLPPKRGESFGDIFKKIG